MSAMGKDRSSIAIKFGNIKCVKFKDKALVEKAVDADYDTAIVDIIGRPQLNEWLGQISVQLIIEQVDIYNQQQKKSLF